MKKKVSRLTVLSLLLSALMAAWLFIAVTNTENAASRQETAALETSVKNAALLCYSVEGEYPANLAYLTDNYGVYYDSDRYIVHYEYFGANIRPDVTVISK